METSEKKRNYRENDDISPLKRSALESGHLCEIFEHNNETVFELYLGSKTEQYVISFSGNNGMFYRKNGEVIHSLSWRKRDIVDEPFGSSEPQLPVECISFASKVASLVSDPSAWKLSGFPSRDELQPDCALYLGHCQIPMPNTKKNKRLNVMMYIKWMDSSRTSTLLSLGIVHNEKGNDVVTQKVKIKESPVVVSLYGDVKFALANTDEPMVFTPNAERRPPEQLITQKWLAVHRCNVIKCPKLTTLNAKRPYSLKLSTTTSLQLTNTTKTLYEGRAQKTVDMPKFQRLTNNRTRGGNPSTHISLVDSTKRILGKEEQLNFFPQNNEQSFLSKGMDTAFNVPVPLSSFANAIDKLKLKGVDTTLQGLIAADIFSNSKYSIADLLPLPKATISYSADTTVDIDQVSLEVVNLGPLLLEHARQHDLKTFDQFCQFHWNGIQQSVFNNHIPGELNQFSFKSFFNPFGESAGGNTYMHSKKRNAYIRTNWQDHLGESFRSGLLLNRLSIRSNMGDISGWEMPFDEGATMLLAESERMPPYHLRSERQRIFTGLVLAARHINSRTWGFHAKQCNIKLQKLGWQALSSSNEFGCHGGSVIQFLATVITALLEEWARISFYQEVNGSFFSVSASFETYGGKVRGNGAAIALDSLQGTTNNEKAIELAALLQPAPGSVRAIIHLFSTYCANELKLIQPNRNMFFWGVGITTSGRIASGDAVYASFPLSKMQRWLQPDKRSDDRVDQDTETQASDEDDDIASDEDHENMLAPELKDVVDKLKVGTTLQLCTVDKHKCKWTLQFYHVHGGLLPTNQQPYTLQMNGSNRRRSFCVCCVPVKLQHYDAFSRLSIGQKNSSTTLTATEEVLASVTYLAHAKYCTDPKVDMSDTDFRYDNVQLKCQNCIQNLNENCNMLKETGNAARLEMGFKCTTFANHLDGLRESIFNLLECADTTLTFYDIIKPLTTTMLFFANGLRQRSDFANMLLGSDVLTRGKIHNFFQYLMEECCHWHKWYNGRNMFAANALICSRLSVLINRPILIPMTTDMLAIIRDTIPQYCELYLEFEHDIGIVERPTPPVLIRPKLRMFATPTIPQGQVCCQCGYPKLRGDGDGFLDHPCYAESKNDRMAVDVSSLACEQLINDMYDKLSDAQKTVVDFALKGHNMYLTGYAGCGKSKSLVCTIAKLRATYGVDAVACITCTKAASAHIQGSTLHAFLGLGAIDIEDLFYCSTLYTTAWTNIVSNETLRTQLLNIHTIIIDEVSMLHGRILDLLDILYRDLMAVASNDAALCIEDQAVRREQSNTPFGGRQVLLCGDILQMPPLSDVCYNNWNRAEATGNLHIDADARKKFWKFIKTTNRACPQLPFYFFLSDVWGNEQAAFHVCYLTEIFRQSDSSVHALLNRLRDGIPTDDDIAYINSQCGSDISEELVKFLIETMHELHNRENTRKQQANDYKLNSIYIHKPLPINELQKELMLRPFTKEYDSRYSKYQRLQAALSSTFIVGMEHVEVDAIEAQLALYKPSHVVTNNDTNVMHLNAATCVYTSRQNIDLEHIKDLEGYGRGFKDSSRDGLVRRSLWVGGKPMGHDTGWEKTLVPNLELKIGQKVIFTTNRIKYVSNNETGIVRAFRKGEDGKVSEILVEKLSPHHSIWQPTVSVKKIIVLANAPWRTSTGQNSIRMVEQFPLKPASWSTPQPLQGMSLDQQCLLFNNIRNSRNNWGLFYVLFSRMINVKKFATTRSITRDEVRANPYALVFDRHHRPPNESDSRRTVFRIQKVNYNKEFVFKTFGPGNILIQR